MKVALAQLNYTIGDFEANKVKIIDAIGRARREGADLAVFAEAAISGTPAYDLLNNVAFLESAESALVEIAAASDGIAVLVGLPVQQGNRTVSAAAFIDDRRICRYITKRSVTMRDEMPFLSSGRGCEYVSVAGSKVAVVVGGDIMERHEYVRYADTVVNLSAHSYSRACIEKRYDVLSQLSYTAGKNFVFVNQIGGSTDIIYDGSSAVYDSHGRAVALLGSFREDFAVVDLDADNRPLQPSYQNKTANVYSAIKLGLSDFFGKNGYATACLGLSGGIDSAVVAAIAAEVLGPENVRVLLMPSLYSSDHSVEDAELMARSLGLPYDVAPITEIYAQVLNTMKPVLGDQSFGVTEENIQARIRCVMLMALSNRFGNILLNTSNKSELAVGYGTLYGDNTGVLSILGDVYKSEVFDLARHINREREVIPERILQKEPSAELRPFQKDTDCLPPYDVVDAVIYRMIEEGQHREEIIGAGFDAETVNRIHDMILRNEQKRYQFCPILRVSTRPFGKGRVMPITNKYRI